MEIKRYVEMMDTENQEIVDIYGYENEVVVWGRGFVKTYYTNNLEQTKEQMQYVIHKLMDFKYVVINQEVRNHETH